MHNEPKREGTALTPSNSGEQTEDMQIELPTTNSVFVASNGYPDARLFGDGLG